MTFKKFVENTIIRNCEKSVDKFISERSYIWDSKIENLDMSNMTYKVKIAVHNTGSFFDKIYYIGGAFNEYATCFDSVIWNENNDIIYMFNATTRKELNLPDIIEL